MRGNTERYGQRIFQLWKCPKCLTIHSLEPVDLADIYTDYALDKRRLDHFSRATSRNLLRRLQAAGLRRSDSILDVGCGPGVFLEYLRLEGYQAHGYDPYSREHADLPTEEAPFECVVSNDTIEHVEDPRAHLRQCADMLRPGGLLYVGTADSAPVSMRELDHERLRLHQPFHRMIFTEQTLRDLGTETGLEMVRAYRRSYHDTIVPFANYRFLDELTAAADHNLDTALDPKASARLVATRPALWLYGVLGYFTPSADEPAIILRKA